MRPGNPHREEEEDDDDDDDDEPVHSPIKLPPPSPIRTAPISPNKKLFPTISVEELFIYTFGGKGEGLREGEGNLSSERFPSPSLIFSTFPLHPPHPARPARHGRLPVQPA